MDPRLEFGRPILKVSAVLSEQRCQLLSTTSKSIARVHAISLAVCRARHRASARIRTLRCTGSSAAKPGTRSDGQLVEGSERVLAYYHCRPGCRAVNVTKATIEGLFADELALPQPTLGENLAAYRTIRKIKPEPDLGPLRDWILSRLSRRAERWQDLHAAVRPEWWLPKHVNELVRELKKEGALTADPVSGRKRGAAATRF